MTQEINGGKWIMEIEKDDFQLLASKWWCDDGDGADLIIEKDNSGFELFCFSGIASSKIKINTVDFGVLWRKAFGEELPINNYTHVQQCVMIADWLCSLFCEWKDVSSYEKI